MNIKDRSEIIRWRCRRGMLELDIFLIPFFDHCFEQLSDHEKKLFVKLLEYPDPELLSWLMGNTTPKDLELVKMAEQIRGYRLRNF